MTHDNMNNNNSNSNLLVSNQENSTFKKTNTNNVLLDIASKTS
ncbi:MAG TPA: hypothetical protein VJU85_08580 [Nitrososphaeraceae archaeon]|nr:hypothetical protein [Nitrososphaeraceae archaeon]